MSDVFYVLERGNGLDPANPLEYWAGASSWTTEIRSAAQMRSRAAAQRRLDNIPEVSGARISEHAWMASLGVPDRCKDHSAAFPCPFGCHGSYTSMAGPAAPAPLDPTGRWSDERLTSATDEQVVELYQQLTGRVAQGGTQHDEMFRFRDEILKRLAQAAPAPLDLEWRTVNRMLAQFEWIIGPSGRPTGTAWVKREDYDELMRALDAIRRGAREEMGAGPGSASSAKYEATLGVATPEKSSELGSSTDDLQIGAACGGAGSPEPPSQREASYAEFRESIRAIAKEHKQSPHELDALAFAGTLLDAAWRAVQGAGSPDVLPVWRCKDCGFAAEMWLPGDTNCPTCHHSRSWERAPWVCAGQAERPRAPSMEDLLALAEQMPNAVAELEQGDYTLRMLLRIAAGALGGFQARAALSGAPTEETP